MPSYEVEAEQCPAKAEGWAMPNMVVWKAEQCPAKVEGWAVPSYRVPLISHMCKKTWFSLKFEGIQNFKDGPKKLKIVSKS